MNRWVALLIAVIAGGIAGVVVGSAIIIGLYAVLWMFVFGDNSWPEWVRPAMDLALQLLCLMLWAAFGWAIWRGLTRRRGAN
ncbi:MAG: hypothetical protein HOQ20_11115 [Bradyrhizobium sp.]|nr:hypothetical protein [Bradyrhizobium sp.]